MDRRHAGAGPGAHIAPRRCREFIDIVGVVGPMAGQYPARQRMAEARHGEVARAEALQDAEGTRGAALAVVARLRRIVGTGLVRASARLRGGRRTTSAALAAGPIGTTQRTSAAPWPCQVRGKSCRPLVVV